MHVNFAAGENVTMELGEDYPELRQSVRRVCERYPGAYLTTGRLIRLNSSRS
jgi:hypothetical protein